MARLATAFVLTLLALPTATLAAQHSDDQWLDDCRRDKWRERRVTHCEIRESGMRATAGALTVDPGMNGGIAIEGWDRDSVAVTARIQVHARTEEDGRAIARAIRIEASGRNIRAVGPAAIGRHQSWSVSFIVQVPRRSDLALETNNGPLSVRDVRGRMELATQNGPLVLEGVGGDVRARVQNGPLSVRLGGARWDGAGLDAEAVNGPAILTIPEGYGAELEFGTVNGPMTVDFPLTVTIQGRVTQRVSSTLGSGGPPVKVVTRNGPMVVRRS